MPTTRNIKKEDQVASTKTKDTTSVNKVETEEAISNTTLKTKNTVRKYELTDLVLCKCVKPHEVIYVSSKTGNYYEFSGYGDEQEVEFQDLKALLTRKSGYLFEPSFIVMDEELLEQPMWKNLIPIYERLINVDTLDEIFDLTEEEFKEKLLIAPEGTKEAILSTATKMIKENTFQDLRKLRIIDEVFGSSLKDFI